MMNRIIASTIAVALLSGSLHAQEANVTEASKQISFRQSLENYFLFSLVGLAISFKHMMAKNPTAGNDRIIFAAAHKRDDAFTEGYADGGSVQGATTQCEANKSAYEKAYGKGICERIREYAPNAHAIEDAIWNFTLYFVVIPATVVGGLVLACTGKVIHSKLKKD